MYFSAMMRIMLVVLVMVAPLGALAGDYLDSLKTELDRLSGKEAQCDRLSEVTFDVINQDPAIAYECAEYLMELASASGYKKGVAYATYHFGNINNYQDEFEEGRKNLGKANELFEGIGDRKGQGFACNSMGEMLTTEGVYGEALEWLQKALDHFKAAGSPEGIAWVNNNIGLVYYYQNNYREAMVHFQEALKTADKIRSGDAWLYITRTYLDQEQFAEAEKSVQKALDLANQNQDAYVLADCYFCLGRIEAYYGKNPAALEHLRNGLRLKEELEDLQGVSGIANHIGDLFLKMDEPDSALVNFREALSAASSVGIKLEMSAACLGLSNVFNRMAMYDSAYHYLSQHNQLDDELQGEEAGKKLAEMQAALAAEQREKEIENERKLEAARKEAEKKEKRLMLIGGIVVIVMLVIFSIFMVNRFRMKQRANKQLEAFNKEIMHQRDIIEEKNKDILDSIKYAKRIQEAILPSDKVLRAGLPNHFVLYRPKDIVSGDFYWAAPVRKSDFSGFLIATVDCTGHGVPGAMVSVVGYNGLNRAVQEYGLYHPNELLDKLNELVEDTFSKHESEVRDGMDISLCLIDPVGMKMEWSGANNPIWMVRNGVLTETKADKQPIGRYEGRKPFTRHQFDLLPGDAIYIFSDGYADQFGGPDEKKFKAAKMKELIMGMQDESMAFQCNRLDEALLEWRHWPGPNGEPREVEQLDDVCVIGVRV
jgi:serine phosphatase RsbU (regulator of sigma subunit)